MSGIQGQHGRRKRRNTHPCSNKWAHSGPKPVGGRLRAAAHREARRSAAHYNRIINRTLDTAGDAWLVGDRVAVAQLPAQAGHRAGHQAVVGALISWAKLRKVHILAQPEPHGLGVGLALDCEDNARGAVATTLLDARGGGRRRRVRQGPTFSCLRVLPCRMHGGSKQASACGKAPHANDARPMHAPRCSWRNR